MRRVGRGDLVEEKPGKDEADAGAAGAADVGEHFGEGFDGDGDNVAKDYDDCCDDGEAGFAHGVVA